jgi:hypothetical protein
MWREAMASANVTAPFISLEALSRRPVQVDQRASARFDARVNMRVDASVDARVGAQVNDPVNTPRGLVIVDEAHHVCNPATVRYARLARLASNRRVLLLSATPVRNRRAELAALLALFMGPRAHALDAVAVSRWVVRRCGDASLRPAIDGPHWHHVRAIPRLRGMIASLPPPVPALDGRAATALLSMTLARCWASSLAALDAALRRRLHRGAALEALLDAGRLPTRDELRTWVVGDDAVQLAFPMLAVHKTSDAARLRAVLTTHLDAVRAMRVRIQPQVKRDADARAALILDLRRTHDRARIVAFTAHSATAEALYRALSHERGVALLTAHGARTAGGLRPRADVIDALEGGHASRGRERDEISLVIATDLLSEGVNLQGASVIVHLDVPWNPAGLDQRVGRAARMGSRHACVHVHGFLPPGAAERLLTLERRFARKHAEQAEAARAPREIEELRALVRSWRGDAPADGRVASVHAERPGFIAVVESCAGVMPVCGMLRRNDRWHLSESPGELYEMARAVSMRAAGHDAAFESRARAELAKWLAARRALESSGGAAAPTRARRRLLARIDVAVGRAGARSRAALMSRIAHVRRLIDSAISAGAERILDELDRDASSEQASLESMLAACETRLADGTAPAVPNSGNVSRTPDGRAAALDGPDGHAVRALLLLLPRPD